MEEWKVIDFATNYEVSNLGHIRNRTTKKVLKGRDTKSGYLQVSLKLNNTNKFQNQYIHRVVALIWIPNPEEKKEVNHIDGNKLNNHVENLEWCTRQENIEHCILNKLQKPFKGEEIGNSKLFEFQVIEIRNKFIPRVYSRAKLAKEYNVSEATIKDILYKRTWIHLL